MAGSIPGVRPPFRPFSSPRGRCESNPIRRPPLEVPRGNKEGQE
jgi:hypothetical protein